MTFGADLVIIIGGGHNGLVAATYLARAGRRVRVHEARRSFGGAVASAALFPGIEARLSRFSYLVSLLPDQIVSDLGLRLELRPRGVKSYTPVGAAGLLVERSEGAATRASFADLTGDTDEFEAWLAWDSALAELAATVAPTLTEPLRHAQALRDQLPADLWTGVVERPLGELLEARLSHDVTRGIALTDALIGILTAAHDPTLRQNRCFLYHVIGNGTGQWRVPVGGMGAVAVELARVAGEAGVELCAGSAVTDLRPLDTGGAEMTLANGSVQSSDTVLVNCAPAVLQRLLGHPRR